ncbi:hypothetical protein GCM10027447_04450 [Glycomyces halotolerans]
MTLPKPSERSGAELIAKELAFEAMKWLLRHGGDATRLSELGLAALAWAGAEPDERNSQLLRSDTESGGDSPRARNFVRNTENRVWATKPILKARGWTDAAVRDFLPEPEGFKPNPRFAGSGHPMPVWLPETVAEAEASKNWQVWLRKSLHRRGTTLRAVAETDDDDFRRRQEAVQAAIDAYHRAQITRTGAIGVLRKEVEAT